MLVELMDASIYSGNIAILNVSLESMELVHTLNNGHSDIVRAVSWRNNSLLSAGEDGRVNKWVLS